MLKPFCSADHGLKPLAPGDACVHCCRDDWEVKPIAECTAPADTTGDCQVVCCRYSPTLVAWKKLGQCLEGEGESVAPAECAGVCEPLRDCDDGNPCTQDDWCDVNGKCVGLPRTCNDNDACTTDACDPAIGCVFTPIPGCGAECVSNSQCLDDTPCAADSCTGGTCVHEPLSDTPCPDADPCTTDERCVAGVCQKSPVDECQTCQNDDDCPDGAIECLVGRCTGGAYSIVVASGGPCDDADPCTQGDTCDSFGFCLGEPIPGCGKCLKEKAPCNGGGKCCEGLICHHTGVCLPCSPEWYAEGLTEKPGVQSYGCCQGLNAIGGRFCSVPQWADLGKPCNETIRCMRGECKNGVCAACTRGFNEADFAYNPKVLQCGIDDWATGSGTKLNCCGGAPCQVSVPETGVGYCPHCSHTGEPFTRMDECCTDVYATTPHCLEGVCMSCNWGGVACGPGLLPCCPPTQCIDSYCRIP